MLIFKKKLWILLLWSIKLISFQEFLYPVGIITHNNKHKICILYQKNSHLELWIWDPESLEAVKGLLSSYTPAGIRVLPNESEFSFIDNDRIRIKDLTKRSPCTLDLPYGPYDLSTIEWIDDETFYFCARVGRHLNLFHANRQGELLYLTRSTTNDFSYPQKIKDTLFFIAKDNNETTIERAEYPIKNLPTRSWDQNKNFKEQLKKLFDEENDTFTKTYLDLTTQEKIYTWTDPEKELAFLFMKNNNKGYFLTHPAMIDESDDHMMFECYTFTCEPNTEVKRLFSFNVPLHLLMPKHNQPERLYESILPLLPMYYEDSVYYSHDSGKGLQLYQYNEKIDQSQLLTESENTHHFAPLCYGNKIYYGGTVSHSDGLSCASPEMWITQNGEQSFNFPILQKESE